MHAKKLDKEIATHSSILAWKIPRTEEPGRLQSMGSQSWTRLGDFTSLHAKKLPPLRGATSLYVPRQLGRPSLAYSSRISVFL